MTDKEQNALADEFMGKLNLEECIIMGKVKGKQTMHCINRHVSSHFMVVCALELANTVKEITGMNLEQAAIFALMKEVMKPDAPDVDVKNEN